MKRTLPTIICKLFAHDNKQKSSLLWLQTFKRPDEDNVAIRGKQNLIRTFFSFVIFPVFLEAKQQFLISQIVSLAIKEELDTYTTDISIKWPNDIYWKDKKICGMLIENDLMGRNISQSIAGVGININQDPVSLFQITGKQYDIFNILEHIMLRIQIYYDLLQKNNTALITAQYERSLFRKEGMYRYKDVNGEFMANIVCVEPEGRLILEDETQTKRGYMFKEVEYLLK